MNKIQQLREELRTMARNVELMKYKLLCMVEVLREVEQEMENHQYELKEAREME